MVQFDLKDAKSTIIGASITPAPRPHNHPRCRWNQVRLRVAGHDGNSGGAIMIFQWLPFSREYIILASLHAYYALLSPGRVSIQDFTCIISLGFRNSYLSIDATCILPGQNLMH